MGCGSKTWVDDMALPAGIQARVEKCRAKNWVGRFVIQGGSASKGAECRARGPGQARQGLLHGGSSPPAVAVGVPSSSRALALQVGLVERSAHQQIEGPTAIIAPLPCGLHALTRLRRSRRLSPRPCRFRSFFGLPCCATNSFRMPQG